MKLKDADKKTKKISSIKADLLCEEGSELVFTVKGNDYKKIINALPEIENAMKFMDMSRESLYSVSQFIIESVRNAMKARGSKILFEKYGPFEKIMKNHDSPAEIIDKIITEAYSDTVIKFFWYNSKHKIQVSVVNNTPLNEYLIERIENSLNREGDISLEEMEKIADDDSIYSTKASGMGMGLWMVMQTLKNTKGEIHYYSTDSDTVFTLEIYKN